MPVLYQHQQDDAKWLALNPHGLLGNEPGTGKTYTAVAGLQAAGARRPLIVCPAIVRTHWRRVLEAMGAEDATVLSYDAIVRGGMPLMATLVAKGKIDALVADEHHYCKAITSQRSQLLFGRDGYARRLEIVHPLSGTPSPRHPGELWTVLSCLHPLLMQEHGLRTHADFLERFCIVRRVAARGAWRDKVVGMQNDDELQHILGAVMSRRTAGDDVPKLWWQTLRLDGDEVAAAALEAEFGPTMNAIQARLLTGASIADLLADPQTSRLRRILGELKVPAVVERIRSELAASDEKLVVFAYHRSVLAALRECLATFGVAYIDGDVPDTKRASEIDRFQSDPKCRIFLGQNVACQTGITLTAASRVMIVEPEWTHDVNLQLGHRVARIGQTAARCVAQLVALAGTIDEAILGQCQREAEMFTRTYGQGGQ